MNPYKRKEVLGDCTLYLGDCLEILPTLEKVDAVITDGIMGHEKSTGRKRKEKRSSFSALGKQTNGDYSSLSSRGILTSGACGSLWDHSVGYVQDTETTWNQGEVSRAQGDREREIYSRSGEHTLPQYGGEEFLRGMRGYREPLRASQERKPSGQPKGKPSSAVLSVSQQTPQKRMVGKTQDLSIRLFA